MGRSGRVGSGHGYTPCVDRVQIVFFDAGGTLLRPEPAVGEVYAATGRRYGIDVSPKAITEAFRETFLERKLDARPQDREWWREVVVLTFGRFGRATDPDGLFDDLYAHFSSPEAWRLFHDARETVETLRTRGYQTGLLSNWDDRLEEVLDGLGLLELLDPVVISCRVGVDKPHPLIFETALTEAGVEPAHALMVGDDWEADIEGSRATGMRAVLVQHDGHTAPDGPVIRRLGELLDLLPARALTP